MNKSPIPTASNELRVAYQIKRQLNHGLSDIGAEKLERLRAGREQALTKQKRAPTLAAAMSSGGRLSLLGLDFSWAAHAVPLLVMLVGLMTINYWHQARYTEEVAEIDAQMLVDELPPSAYLDRGFDAWLKRGRQ